MNKTDKSKKAIKTPVVPEGMTQESGLQDVIEEVNRLGDDLSLHLFKNCCVTDMEIERISFDKIIFDHCNFENVSFEGCSFGDVIFKNCSFVKCSFSGGIFSRCEFSGSRSVGGDFTSASFMNLNFQNSSFRYANFTTSRFDRVSIKSCDMRGAFLARCSLEDTVFSDTDFTEGEFYYTSLTGMDLTSCKIFGVRFSDGASELKGATVDVYQAAELARLLGVNIKE